MRPFRAAALVTQSSGERKWERFKHNKFTSPLGQQLLLLFCVCVCVCVCLRVYSRVQDTIYQHTDRWKPCSNDDTVKMMMILMMMMMMILVASFLSSLLSCGLTTRGTTQCPPFWTPSTTPSCVPTCRTQRETLLPMVCDHGWWGGGWSLASVVSDRGGGWGGGATCQIQRETLLHMVVCGGWGVDDLRDTEGDHTSYG